MINVINFELVLSLYIYNIFFIAIISKVKCLLLKLELMNFLVSFIYS
jgi:hypothetical protein